MVVGVVDFDTDLATQASLLDGAPETLAADVLAVGERELASELLRSESFFYSGWGGQL
jgi:hypothetical protein